MKRCPQCLFLFPDSDEKCDFDQTPLEVIDEATIAATVNSRPKRRTLPFAAAIGLILGVLGFAIYYYAASRQSPVVEAAPQNSTVAEPVSTPVPTEPSPSPSVSPLPSPSATPTVKASPNGVSTSHTRSTLDPVSTSGPGIAARQGSKPIIMLTSGGKVEADEVWRTKDGVWYRRNGMVTLLKRNQVKTIVTR